MRSTGGVAAFLTLHMFFEDQQRPLECEVKITSEVTKTKRKYTSLSIKVESVERPENVVCICVMIHVLSAFITGYN